MRFAPFALLALCALPACAPYGYGYSGSYAAPAYGAPGYGSPAPAYYGSPYYGSPGYPGYVAPAEGVVVFGDHDDRRGYDRRYDNRGNDRGNDNRQGGGPRGAVAQEQQRQARPAPQPQQRPASVFVGPQGGGAARGGGGDRGHSPEFDPANPGAHGGGDR